MIRQGQHRMDGSAMMAAFESSNKGLLTFFRPMPWSVLLKEKGQRCSPNGWTYDRFWPGQEKIFARERGNRASHSVVVKQSNLPVSFSYPSLLVSLYSVLYLSIGVWMVCYVLRWDSAEKVEKEMPIPQSNRDSRRIPTWKKRGNGIPPTSIYPDSWGFARNANHISFFQFWRFTQAPLDSRN